MTDKKTKAHAPIWQKSSTGTLPNQEIMQFLAGQDVILDRELLLFDVQASKAHINALATIDILKQDEVLKLNSCLDELSDDFKNGDFILDARFEDCHSAIEWYLTDKLGSLGGYSDFRLLPGDQVFRQSGANRGTEARSHCGGDQEAWQPRMGWRVLCRGWAGGEQVAHSRAEVRLRV